MPGCGVIFPWAEATVRELVELRTASAGVAHSVSFVEIERRPGGMTYEHGGSSGDAVVVELRPCGGTAAPAVNCGPAKV